MTVNHNVWPTEVQDSTTVDNSDPIKLFMEQMIPHHANAVNMAKLIYVHGPYTKLMDNLDNQIRQLRRVIQHIRRVPTRSRRGVNHKKKALRKARKSIRNSLSIKDQISKFRVMYKIP